MSYYKDTYKKNIRANDDGTYPSTTYRRWTGMRQRCINPKHPAFIYYGGRGIRICERWLNSFEAFLADMGEAPPGLWLDRIDSNKGYEPGNCRWVTPEESAKNRSKTGPKINPNSLLQKAKRAGIPYIRVIQRMRMGWTEEQALSIPVQRRGGMTLHDRELYGIRGGARGGQ